jgi:hypothetical protein
LPVAVHADQRAKPTVRGSVLLVWIPATPAQLDRLRGGFVDLSGVKVSFGLERMVWVNGQLVQSLALTVPDLTSLPLKGSAGAVSVQGPAPIVVIVDPVKVDVQPVNVQPGSAAQPSAQPASAMASPPPTSAMASPPPASAMASPPPVSAMVSPPPASAMASPPPVSAIASPPPVSAVTPGAASQATSPAGAGSPVQQPAVAAASSAHALPTSTPSLVNNASSQGVPTAVTVIQNGPGNVITSDLLNNLGPGVLTVFQNSLNDQTIRGLTILNAQVSGLGSLARHDAFSNLTLMLRGLGR